MPQNILIVLALFCLSLLGNGCQKDCSKNTVGSFSLSDSAIRWVPAPTERNFRMISQVGDRDSFTISTSTAGPVFYDGIDEQRCEAFTGQNFTMDVRGDSTGFELFTTANSNQERETIQLGVPNFGLSVDLDDYKIVGLDNPIGNINGEIEVMDTASFGTVLYFDVIKINILDPENITDFTQFHYAKSVGFVQLLDKSGLEWVRR